MYENYTVLFVDDEQLILNSLRRGLIDEEYKCLFASSAKEALEILAREEISVIVSDMRMPEMDGLALLKKVRAEYPKTVRIVLSGYTQLQQVLATVNQADIFKFITKPWKLENDSKVIITQALDYYRLQKERDEFAEKLTLKNQAYQNILKHTDMIVAASKANLQMFGSLSAKTYEILQKSIQEEYSQELLKVKLKAVSTVFNAITKTGIGESSEMTGSSLSEMFSESLRNLNEIEKVEIKNNLPEMFKMDLHAGFLNTLICIACQFICSKTGQRLVVLSLQSEKANSFTQLSVSVLICPKPDVSYNKFINNSIIMKDSELDMLDQMLRIAASYINGEYKYKKVENNIILKFIITQ